MEVLLDVCCALLHRTKHQLAVSVKRAAAQTEYRRVHTRMRPYLERNLLLLQHHEPKVPCQLQASCQGNGT